MDLIGQEFGPYRVLSPLGAGGMGEVYRAVDTKFNRPVAIKFLSEAVADAAGRRRFQREAQTASSLNHPHILTVHDAGDFDGRQYLVTELPPIKLRRNGERTRFTPDGKALIYMQGDLQSQEFWMLDLVTKKTRPLTRLTRRDPMRTFTVTPDGKRIVFDRLRENSDIVLIDLPR